MQFDPDRYRRDAAIAASGDPNKPATERQAAAHLQDTLPALRPQEPPYAVTQGQIAFFLPLLVNAIFGNKVGSFEALEDEAAAREALAALPVDWARRVVEATGYFAPSFADPKVSRVKSSKRIEMPIALGREAGTPASHRFASGLNTAAAIESSFAGNAADNRLAKLFSSRIADADTDGQPRTLIEYLHDEHAFGRALLELGLDETVKQAAVEAFETQQQAGLSAVTAIDGNRMKAVFVPDGHGGYWQVSPVPSVALYTELPRRIRQRRQAGQWVRRSQRLTSAKTQNVGLQANYQGGRLTRIHASYRRIDTSAYQRRLAALRQGAATFFQANVLHDTEETARLGALLRTILNASEEGYVNADIRAGRDRRIQRLLDTLIEDLEAFQDFVAWQPTPFETEGETRRDHLAEVLVLARRRASPDELDAVAEDMAAAILSAIQRDDPSFTQADARDDRVYRPVFEEARAVAKEELGV